MSRATFEHLAATHPLRRDGTPTSVSTAGGATITAAMMGLGIYVRDCNGASRADTFDTASNLIAAFPELRALDVMTLLIVNGSDAAETLTLTAGVGGGFDTNQTAASRVIPQNTSKLVFIRITSVTSPAYVIYS